MEKQSSIKNVYLLFAVSALLIVLAVGSTYAVFTVDKKIDSPIVFSSTLISEDGVIDTINVSIDSGETKRSTLNITNDSDRTLNYVVWTDNKNNNIQLGINSGSSSGSLASGDSITVVIDIRNSGKYSENVVLGISSSSENVVLGNGMKMVSNESLPPIIASGNTWYNGSVDKATITKINFVDSYTVTGNENESWNAAFDIDGDGSLNNDIMCYLNGTELTIAGNGTGKIYANEDSSYLFGEFTALTTIDNLTLLDTSNVTSMVAMFYACNNLTSLDLSNFDTSNVTTMRSMFNRCFAIETLDLSSFDTKNVDNMFYMFYECNNLSNLYIDSFDTSKVTDMRYMFYNCYKLVSLDLGHFNTKNVTNMAYMFFGCNGLTSLDVSNFDTSSVTSFRSMFNRCSSLTSLDLSTFSVTNATTIQGMFYNCTALKTIYVSNLWNSTGVETSTEMFSGCSSLVGGAGTKYNSSYIDKTYARVDSSSTPGYFTYKDASAL